MSKESQTGLSPRAESEEEEVKGGYLHLPALTDSMGNMVCGHQGVDCDILWKIGKLVPDVPLRKRTWINAGLKGDSVYEAALTRDQHWRKDPTGLGITLSIGKVESVDLVSGYWKGKVGVCACVHAEVLASKVRGEFNLTAEAGEALLALANGDHSEETRQRALDLVNQAVDLFRAGNDKKAPEFKVIEGMNEAEGLMRFLQFGVINWYRLDDGNEYPCFSGDSYFQWDGSTNRLKANFTVTSLWKNTPDLHKFPFDINGLCAIFWSKAFPVQVRKGSGVGIGGSFQEFDMFDFRGESKPFPQNIWDPYYPESNVVRNTARGEQLFYVRFWVRRKAAYHVVSALIPSVLIGLLGVPALMVADGTSPNSIVSNSESPVSFVAALLLTLMALKLAFADSLPKLGYLTMLDWHLAINFSMLAAVIAIMVTVDEDRLGEWYVTPLYFGAQALFNAIFFGKAWYSYRIPVEKIPCLTFPESKSLKQ